MTARPRKLNRERKMTMLVLQSVLMDGVGTSHHHMCIRSSTIYNKQAMRSQWSCRINSDRGSAKHIS